jgi:uncharacterized protein (TIGR00288 family)
MKETGIMAQHITALHRRGRRRPRVLVVVDVQNMCHPSIRVDYAKMQNLFREWGDLAASVAFVTDAPETLNFQLMLRHSGYHVEALRPVTNGHGVAKGNADLLMAFWLGDALQSLRFGQGDIVVLCTGDADFVPIVERLRARGLHVVVIAYKASAAPRLQIVADRFYAIEDTAELQRRESAQAA